MYVIVASNPSGEIGITSAVASAGDSTALMLQTFARTSFVWLSRPTMMKCPYFKKMSKKKWKVCDSLEVST